MGKDGRREKDQPAGRKMREVVKAKAKVLLFFFGWGGVNRWRWFIVTKIGGILNLIFTGKWERKKN